MLSSPNLDKGAGLLAAATIASLTAQVRQDCLTHSAAEVDVAIVLVLRRTHRSTAKMSCSRCAATRAATYRRPRSRI